MSQKGLHNTNILYWNRLQWYHSNNDISFSRETAYVLLKNNTASNMGKTSVFRKQLTSERKFGDYALSTINRNIFILNYLSKYLYEADIRHLMDIMLM